MTTTIRAAVVVSAIAAASFFWRVLSLPPADRRSARLRQPQFRARLVLHVRRRHRHVRHHLSDPAVSRAGARLQRLQIGETVVVTGLAQMVMSPFSAYIARKLDLRIMLAIGLGLFAVSMYLTAGLTNQASFVELFVPQAVRGFALMFCYLPANLIALSTVPPDKLKNAAGLYNLTRDLGGAIALATIGTIMNNRLHFHWNRLIEDVNPARPSVQQFLDTRRPTGSIR